MCRRGTPNQRHGRRPGLIAVDDILVSLLTTVPVEAAPVKRPDGGSPRPQVWEGYADLLGSDFPLQPLALADFYAACKTTELALGVASGDARFFANILLAVGAAPATTVSAGPGRAGGRPGSSGAGR
ncbi:RbsD/FucU domain-containing protein [Actinokineospora sp. UTMC 2448]|uniref:RbsD/FucU domain-containing protein n=1 Tax=Actinokineospora sp. UTMC 2448 TaxID=2268449 RepID=UPI0021FA0872|nr:hypothetical protein Actkin_02872 [Actinokineospora sp. UTMC 2448]